ncbi:larval serum protein 1 gamma [Anticarsia gemmatalis]|uniref:larval serum protein 1 gamma n=1 Tax=Anticarsia gemmatalis TaxID=129554 RepID=UPI003F77484D
MKTVLILAGLVALVMGHHGSASKHHDWKMKNVDADFKYRQLKVLSLFEHLNEHEQKLAPSDWYLVAKEYSIEANLEHYTNTKAVKEFLTLYKTGFMPKYHEFSIFMERMRDEVISLFHVFYYAKDFETFYKTAAWAKLYLNEGQFLYAYHIAVVQRSDCEGIVIPAPYEMYPQYFFNKDILLSMYYKYVHGTETDNNYGVVKENGNTVFYANYSSSLSYPNDEKRLSYFTEDIGFNAFYYYFHTELPFWWSADKFGVLKERRGEIYFDFYQQLLARYYMERLTNGLGEIPEFSWYLPFKTGYYPHLYIGYLPFAQRSNYYDTHSENNLEAVRFLDSYEKTFLQFLQQGHFKAFDKEVDFHNPKAINFAGNYWQTNADLYSEEHIEDYQHSYEITARHVLGGSPKPLDKYTFMPSALDFYQTSLRDPAFYQLYQRIVDYLIHFKEYLHPYTHDDLHFVGVKINDVKVDKLVTYFDYYDVNITNSFLLTKQEFAQFSESFLIRQPRLNHEPFSLNINVKSDVACDAVFRVFIGPKYDSNGYPINLEKDWMKFYKLDWFVQKLNAGENNVVRKSSEFIFFKDDSMPTHELYDWLEQGKVPYDMSEGADNLPRRLMLPKGTHGGYPFQMFVFVYPYNGVNKVEDEFKNYIQDSKPFGFPFDRPVQETYFHQPNMYFKDVEIFHKGEVFSYELNTPKYYNHKKN